MRVVIQVGGGGGEAGRQLTCHFHYGNDNFVLIITVAMGMLVTL